MEEGAKKEGLVRVSGPASAFVFRHRGRTLYLFGDVHFSYGNLCRGAGIRTLTDFVGEEMSNATLVVEYPYSTPRMLRSARGRWYFDRIAEALAHDAAASSRLRTVLYRLFGASGPVTGMLSRLYRAQGPSSDPRIVCGDIRSEPNVHAWTAALAEEPRDAVERERARLSDAQVRRWLSAYLLDDDFIGAIKPLFEGGPLWKHFLRRHRGPHEVRRVYLELLPAQADRRRVAAFHDRMISELLRAGKAEEDLSAWVETAQAMVMDTYVIIHALAAPGDVVVYAGAYHTQHYRAFFADAGAELASQNPMRRAADGEVQRCVTVRVF